MVIDAMGFPAVGGRPALDFVATLGKRRTRDLERLLEPSDLARWAGRAGVGALGSGAAVDTATLAAARDLREALYRLCESTLGRRLAEPGDVETVNAWASLPPPPAGVAVVDGRLCRQEPPPSITEVLAAVARDGVDQLTGPDAHRLRECEGPTCTLLFVDSSRDGRRRWCSMDSCGARAKMQALRARRRSEP